MSTMTPGSTATAGQLPFLVPGLPFSGPELRGMELSGLLVHVMGELYLPAHHGRDGLRVRVSAVRRLAEPILSGPWTAIGLTAAWIHGGGAPPSVLEASVGRFHRLPLQPVSVGLRLEQSDVATQPAVARRAESDVVTVHDLRCTTIDRTIEDLLRNGGSPASVEAAAQLLPHCDVGALRERFEQRRKRPGMAGARQTLARLAGPAAGPVVAAKRPSPTSA